MFLKSSLVSSADISSLLLANDNHMEKFSCDIYFKPLTNWQHSVYRLRMLTSERLRLTVIAHCTDICKFEMEIDYAQILNHFVY